MRARSLRHSSCSSSAEISSALQTWLLISERMPSISQKESRSSTTSRTESPDVRISAIDIGSNSIRQIIADVSTTGAIRVVDEMKAAPRLGSGIHETGELSKEARNAAIQALGRMEALSRQLGAK